MDFLWHKVSEKEKADITKQAKDIMDDFSKKLSKVGELKESFIERQECERDENSGNEAEIDKKIMMSNAPKSNDNFIIAEKKKW